MWWHHIEHFAPQMEREGSEVWTWKRESTENTLNVMKTQPPSSFPWRGGRWAGNRASVTGVTHENEMFPKIKKESSRGRRERNVLNRLEYKETAGLNDTSPPPPKAIGFIPKHAELEATNRLCKHPETLSEIPPFGNKNMKKQRNKDGSEEFVEQPCKSVTMCMLSVMFTTTTEQIVLRKHAVMEICQFQPDCCLTGNDNTPKATL